MNLQFSPVGVNQASGSTSIEKKRRGRPPGSKNKKSKPVDDSEPPPPKRPRGRPRKVRGSRISIAFDAIHHIDSPARKLSSKLSARRPYCPNVHADALPRVCHSSSPPTVPDAHQIYDNFIEPKLDFEATAEGGSTSTEKKPRGRPKKVD